MTITRNMTAELTHLDGTIFIEIYNDTDMVASLREKGTGNFVRRIDRKLAEAFFQRTTAWENTTDGFTFKVDHYGA